MAEAATSSTAASPTKPARILVVTPKKGVGLRAPRVLHRQRYGYAAIVRMRIATMASRDLAHQRKPQPSSPISGIGSPIEGFEHALLLVRRDAGAMVAYREPRLALRKGESDLDWRRAVAACVFDQVANQATQQTCIALDRYRLPIERRRLEAGAFFGSECEQIDVLEGFACRRRVRRVQAACEQNFVDQRIQLGDIAL